MTVEIRHLRCFLAIAETGNITRAAALVHLTQPVVSRTLAQLERELGVTLVDRSTHHLALTDAGRRFSGAARDAVESFEQSIAVATQASPPLRFGHSWSGATHAAAIVRAWRTAQPDRPLISRRSDDRTAGLSAGEVDVAFVRGAVDGRRMRFVVVGQEARVAALPAGHVLSSRRQLTLADLAGETLVVNTVSGTTTLDLWPGSARPVVGMDTATIDDWLIAIATSAGVGVSATSTATLHPHPDVRFVPITDAPLIPLLMIWPRRNPHPDCRTFVNVARKVLAGT